jgi:hypothetical protein
MCNINVTAKKHRESIMATMSCDETLFLPCKRAKFTKIDYVSKRLHLNIFEWSRTEISGANLKIR